MNTLDTATAAQPQADSAGRPAVLRVAGVEKSFHRGIWPRRRTIGVLKGASLEVRAGELVGLVGENGSGKSTLMQIVVGLLKRDAGEVDRPARLGYCPQAPMLWDKLTVDEHFDLFARAYGLAEDEASRSVDALLGELDFAKYRGYRIEELSGGTRQKLNLAVADARPTAAAARRALRRLRLGDLPALLGDVRAPPRRRHGHPHRLAPARRARAPGPHVRDP